jgi:hypothetical protein
MKFNLFWKFVMLASIAPVGSLRADSMAIESESNAMKLFVRVVPITVLGRTVKVTIIEQSDGV